MRIYYCAECGMVEIWSPKAITRPVCDWCLEESEANLKIIKEGIKYAAKLQYEKEVDPKDIIDTIAKSAGAIGNINLSKRAMTEKFRKIAALAKEAKRLMK